MKALVALLLLGLLGRAWCCIPVPGDTDIARLGNASQSSTRVDYPIIGYPENAIDGVKDLEWIQGSCSHTNEDWEPWWRLDMKQRYKVKVVVLGLRSDCCFSRFVGMEVRIGDSPDNNNTVCGKITNTNYFAVTFLCNGMEGQFLSVVIPGRSDILTLCEVEVYGDPVI